LRNDGEIRWITDLKRKKAGKAPAKKKPSTAASKTKPN